VKYVVAAADEIPPGGRKIVDVEGRSIGIFNLDGEFFALRNRCPHQAGALCEGTLWGVLTADVPGKFDYSPSREILTCPWHGWEFHVRTGQSWCEPRRLRVRRFDVTVEDGKTLVADQVAVADPVTVADQVAVADPATSEDSPTTEGPPVPADSPAPGLVRGPYLVETYPVSVEGTYLVLEMRAR
jgi:nitrite reductase/ring-hydroxylating ferredoxin subunit